ncbi:hypothetical protein BLA29_009244, partial [Euroglyphus maynei]
MQEIPPLTDEELFVEQEIHDRLYGDVGSVDFNEFFDDVLPSPRHPQPKSPPPILAQPLSPELMPPPMEVTSLSNVDAQRMDDDHAMTGIVTPPLPFFQPSPPKEPAEKQSRKKRSKTESDFSSTIEKRRRTGGTISDDHDHILGSLELPVLDESSILHQPRRRSRQIRRFRLIIDFNNQISSNDIRKNMLESYHWSNTLPNVFIPRKKFFDTCNDLFNRPERSLAKGFDFYFHGASLNTQPEPEIPTTTIERVNGGEMSPGLVEDFFQETLPPPQPTQFQLHSPLQ